MQQSCGGVAVHRTYIPSFGAGARRDSRSPPRTAHAIQLARRMSHVTHFTRPSRRCGTPGGRSCSGARPLDRPGRAAPRDGRRRREAPQQLAAQLTHERQIGSLPHANGNSMEEAVVYQRAHSPPSRSPGRRKSAPRLCESRRRLQGAEARLRPGVGGSGASRCMVERGDGCRVAGAQRSARLASQLAAQRSSWPKRCRSRSLFKTQRLCAASSSASAASLSAFRLALWLRGCGARWRTRLKTS